MSSGALFVSVFQETCRTRGNTTNRPVCDRLHKREVKIILLADVASLDHRVRKTAVMLP